MKIDGKEIAEGIFEELKKQVQNLKEQNITPHLAIILVGNDPASVSYVNQKRKKAEEIGAKATVLNYESGIRNQELIEKIEELNNDPKVHGIIVQRPLPEHINSEEINNATDPKKDVDAFCSQTKFQMPLAAAVLKILEHIYQLGKPKRGVTQIERLPTTRSSDALASMERALAGKKKWQDPERWLKAKNIVVIGKGETGGRPVIDMLKKMGIEPQVIDSKTANSKQITKNADIIISTVGKSNILKAENIKKGVILIGVGMHKGEDDKLHGDYNQDEIKDIASFYTPIPGGVGPVNVAMLLKNLVDSRFHD